VNFLDPRCQSGPFSHLQFGLCDDSSSPVAYVDSTAPESWIATVKNDGQKEVTFTAIDNCVVQNDEQQGRGRCDCMLTTDRALYLVELKERVGSTWKNEAIEQLKSTIELLKATHGQEFLDNYSPKKAFVCNRRKAPFVTLETDRKQLFFRAYGFKLDIQTTVLVV
jgi:hypothetical protein